LKSARNTRVISFEENEWNFKNLNQKLNLSKWRRIQYSSWKLLRLLNYCIKKLLVLH
jgi:hypothetical protein